MRARNLELHSSCIPLVILLALFFQQTDLFSAAGDLDPTFGVNGTVTTDFSGDIDSATAMAIQSDGKLVLAGTVGRQPNIDFAVARYNSDGTLDLSFSDDGKTTTDFYGLPSWAHGLVIQNDGNIVVVGYSYNGTNFDFALARYNSDGSLDTTFSQDGLVTTNITWDEHAFGVVVDSAGKILVEGYTYDGDYTSLFALSRYNSDGTLDISFSEDGIVTTYFQGRDNAHAIALQNDGKIIAGGISGINLALARYNADGTLDPTFSEDGKDTTHILGYGCGFRSIVLQDDGKIVGAGDGYKFTEDKEIFVLVRYKNNGTLDADFAQNGVYASALWGRYDYALSVAIQNDRKIVAAGSALNNNSAVARFNSNGTLDPNFSGDGRVNTRINDSYSAARAVAIQTDGKIVVAGIVGGAGNGDFAIARYLPEGSPCSGTAMFCDDFEDGVVNPGWTIHSSSWTESDGFMISNPSAGKSEIVASPIFNGCQICSVESGLMTTGGLNDKTSFLGWYLDKQNNMELIIKPSSQRIIFKERVKGIVRYKANYKPQSGIHPNTLYQIKIEFDGVLFSVYWVNMSIPLFQFYPFPSVSSGTVGFRVQDNGAYFSYVAVN